jgi:SH3-like domain-containing protein
MLASRFVLAVLGCLAMVPAAWGLDYRSVNVPAATLYDAPSNKAKKLYLIKAQTPVEVVVRLEGWTKIRDAEGTLAWIDATQLAEQRNVIVTQAGAEIRQSELADGVALAKLDKWVVLELLGPSAPGWEIGRASCRERVS